MIYGSDFWSGFQLYLNKTNNHLGTRDRLNYAMKYAYILHTGDARQLLEISHEKRIHIMKSLSALSKYTGRYDRWQQIRQSFQLKWSNGDSLRAFNSIFNKDKDLDHMFYWLKDTCSRLPQKYANVLIFNTLTGLRPSEAHTSISLIHNNIENYLNDDTKILEHFRFPDFIRRTKKAYISIVNDHILEIARSAHKEVTYNQLKFQFKRVGMGAIHMLFCRKIFATYLRIQGVEQEIIDLLQGRIPRNVFVRHYFRPNFAKENEKVTISLENLYEGIR
jgi:Archaeal phage integrase